MHEHAIYQLEQDNAAKLQPDTAWVAKKTKTRKPNRIDRVFSKREYEFSYQFGSVIEQRNGRFGFGTPDRAFLVRSRKQSMPPPGTDLAIAVGTITRSEGKATRPSLVLLGYASEKTGLVYTRGNWHMLFGRPLLNWLITMPVLAVGFLVCLEPPGAPQHPFYGIGALVCGFLLFLGLFWPFCKGWQAIHARYAFKAHVSQLYRTIGR